LAQYQNNIHAILYNQCRVEGIGPCGETINAVGFIKDMTTEYNPITINMWNGNEKILESDPTITMTIVCKKTIIDYKQKNIDYVLLIHKIRKQISNNIIL
jgi:hypothetical protein